MRLDQERIRTILTAEHSYYGSRAAPIRKDYRWYPSSSELIAHQLLPTMRVLDIGCGDGETLLDLSPRFHAGIGIDNDPAHLQLAEDAQQAQGIENVTFRLLDFPRAVAQLDPESFDLVISLRGPVGDTPESMRAALHLLRPEGLLYCEEIGEHHQREVVELFGDHANSAQITPRAEQLRAALAHQGVDIRLVADVFTKWCYPDIYAWLAFQCNVWAWVGRPLPEPDDPQIGLFAERNSSATGEIETTHHVVRVAGVKHERRRG